MVASVRHYIAGPRRVPSVARPALADAPTPRPSRGTMEPLHTCRIEVRSYELDSFGHVNHAVYLNYFEHARFETLRAGGFSPRTLEEREEGVHVVRVEVDYRRELRLGETVIIDTGLRQFRNSSMTLEQTAYREGEPDHVFAEALVVAVWIGPDGRPMRIPPDVRAALGVPGKGNDAG